MEQSKMMLKLIYQALEDKKGEDIVMIDISQVSVLADYFVICSAGNDSQIQALVDNVDERCMKTGIRSVSRKAVIPGPGYFWTMAM